MRVDVLARNLERSSSASNVAHMADWDRMKRSVFAVIKAAFPRIDRYAAYHGKVVSWHKDQQTVDVTPDDLRLPTMSNVPFMHGTPGMVADVVPGTAVMIEWKNGDPARAFASRWLGGERVLKLVMNADELVLGGEEGAEPPPRGTTYRAAEDAYLDAIVVGVNAALSALSLSPAATTLAAAQGAFKAGAASYLASSVKIK